MEDSQAIRKAIDTFIAAYNRGDVEALLAVYAEDLVKIRFRSEIETKQETAVRLREFFKTYSGRLNVRNDEIMIEGTVAFTRGTFNVVAVPRSGGDELHIVRRFVEVWRKGPTGWKVARTMDAEP